MTSPSLKQTFFHSIQITRRKKRAVSLSLTEKRLDHEDGGALRFRRGCRRCGDRSVHECTSLPSDACSARTQGSGSIGTPHLRGGTKGTAPGGDLSGAAGHTPEKTAARIQPALAARARHRHRQPYLPAPRLPSAPARSARVTTRVLLTVDSELTTRDCRMTLQSCYICVSPTHIGHVFFLSSRKD